MINNLLKTALVAAFVVTFFSTPANAQQRDNLTFEEIEIDPRCAGTRRTNGNLCQSD